MRLTIEDYISSPEYIKAINKDTISSLFSDLLSYVQEYSGEKPKDFIENIEKLAKLMTKESQSLFWSPKKLAYQRFIIESFQRLAVSLKLLDSNDIQNLENTNTILFMKLCFLGAALLFDLSKQTSPVRHLTNEKKNCLIGISQYFEEETKLSKVGVKVIPGDIGFMMKFEKGKVKISDSIGRWVEANAIKPELDTTQKNIVYGSD